LPPLSRPQQWPAALQVLLKAWILRALQPGLALLVRLTLRVWLTLQRRLTGWTGLTRCLLTCRVWWSALAGAHRLIGGGRPVRGALRRLSALPVRLARRGLLSGPVRLPLCALLARLPTRPGLVWLPRPVRLVLAIGLSRPIRLSGLVWPLQVRLPLQPGLLLAALGHEPSSDLLGGECLPHKGAVARGLLRRNLERHRGEPPGCARTNRKAGRCARQRSELGAA
jgi:hypothetical protein